MNKDHEHDGEEELQAARRTAHALGQTEGVEQAEVEAELAASPQARQEAEAVQALAARLKEAARAAPQPEPLPALREAVQRRLTELEPAAGRAAAQTMARPWWRRRVAALALAAACLAALAPILWSIDLLGPRREHDVAQSLMPLDNTNPEHAPGSPGEFDKSDSMTDGIEDVPPVVLDVDPTLKNPAREALDAEYSDGSKILRAASCGRRR